MSLRPFIGEMVDLTCSLVSGTLLIVKATQIGIKMTIDIPTMVRTLALPPNPKKSNAAEGINCALKLPTTPNMALHPVTRDLSL